MILLSSLLGKKNFEKRSTFGELGNFMYKSTKTHFESLSQIPTAEEFCVTLCCRWKRVTL